MTNSSIGSGAGTDSNENHPTDGLPTKTMGEETEISPSAPSQTTPVQQEQAELEDATTENELTSPQEVLHSLPIGTAGANPGDFPDGPNVAPSPWEKDAAQGKG